MGMILSMYNPLLLSLSSSNTHQEFILFSSFFIVQEYEQFYNTIVNSLHLKVFDREICEVLLDQQYFNGTFVTQVIFDFLTEVSILSCDVLFECLLRKESEIIFELNVCIVLESILLRKQKMSSKTYQRNSILHRSMKIVTEDSF